MKKQYTSPTVKQITVDIKDILTLSLGTNLISQDISGFWGSAEEVE